MDIFAWAPVEVKSGGKRPRTHTYIVVLNLTQNTALVSSRSVPGTMHQVVGDVCNCPAFGYCAHLQAVAQYWMDQRVKEASHAG